MNDSPAKEVSSLPSVVKVRPMIMFTGFLGAGKTTLLRDVLIDLASRDILSDVILNDRENAYLDRSTLKGHAAEVKALTGSCVCCEGFHDLIDMILKVSKSRHDLLLIELNGTADPVPLQESFTLLESKFCLRPRWQVCVIDPRHFRKRRRFNDLESLQLETASHYYISWSNQLTGQEKLQIKEGIEAINPRATRTTASELAEALSQSIRNNQGYALAAQKPATDSKSSLQFDITPGPEEKFHDRHKLAHEFTGCQIIIPEPVEPSRVKEWLDRLPDSFIRAKALLIVHSDTEKRYLYERVGKVVSPEPTSVHRSAKTECSGILIGADIDPEEILNLTREYLHPACHFPEL